MKRITLKHATLCHWLLYLPVMVFLAVGVIVLALEQAVIGLLSFLLSLLLSLAYLLCFFPLILGGEIAFSTIRYLQKDRLWFAVSQDADSILSRVNRYGLLCEDLTATVQPLAVRYKRQCPLTAFYSSIEKIVVVYRVSALDTATYRMILASTYQVLEPLKAKSKPYFFLTKAERKAPVCRAVAVVILADSVTDFEVLSLVRKLPDFEETAIVPCVVDLYAKRCYFDGVKDIYMHGSTPKPAKNFAIDLIRNIVFGGRLPLKNNPHYDYDQIDKGVLEKPFVEFVRECTKEFYQEVQKDKRISRHLAKTMQDGELVQKDDTLYIKRGDRTAVFLTVEDTPDRVCVLVEDCWCYPKHHKISKALLADMKSQIQEHFSKQQVSVHFEE